MNVLNQLKRTNEYRLVGKVHESLYVKYYVL